MGKWRVAPSRRGEAGRLNNRTRHQLRRGALTYHARPAKASRRACGEIWSLGITVRANAERRSIARDRGGISVARRQPHASIND